MSTLRLITFDLDDTLWPVQPVIRRAEQAQTDWLAAQLAPEPVESVAARLLALRMTVLRERTDLAHDFTALRKLALTRLLQEAGWSPAAARDGAEAGFAVFHAERNRVEPYPDSVATLTALARRYTLHALSNGNADIRRTPFAACFSAHFHAGMAGHAKPHPRLFELSLAEAGVRPDEALHVGDHPEQDVLAAQAVGMRAIWFNPAGLAWPSDTTAPDQVADWPALASRLLG